MPDPHKLNATPLKDDWSAIGLMPLQRVLA
jgi:hypothetical protein